MPNTSKKTLAIIDDDTELLGELTRALQTSYHITTSLGDPGTIRMLQEHPPSAIVLDLDLVTFDAYELMQLVAGDPAPARHAPAGALVRPATSPPSRWPTAWVPPSSSPNPSCSTSCTRESWRAVTDRRRQSGARPSQARRAARRQRPDQPAAARVCPRPSESGGPPPRRGPRARRLRIREATSSAPSRGNSISRWPT